MVLQAPIVVVVVSQVSSLKSMQCPLRLTPHPSKQIRLTTASMVRQWQLLLCSLMAPKMQELKGARKTALMRGYESDQERVWAGSSLACAFAVSVRVPVSDFEFVFVAVMLVAH